MLYKLFVYLTGKLPYLLAWEMTCLIGGLGLLGPIRVLLIPLKRDTGYFPGGTWCQATSLKCTWGLTLCPLGGTVSPVRCSIPGGEFTLWFTPGLWRIYWKTPEWLSLMRLFMIFPNIPRPSFILCFFFSKNCYSDCLEETNSRSGCYEPQADVDHA